MMVLEAISTLANAFAGFFSLYGALDVVLNISGLSLVAIAFWSIVRFLVLPLVGGHYSINDGEQDILSETVTDTVTTSHPKQHLGGGVYQRHTTTVSRSGSHRSKGRK